LTQLIIYGYGGLGVKFYNYIEAEGYKVISIFDRNKVDQIHNNIPVTNPEDNLNKYKDIDIVITILNEYVDIDKVKEYLIDLGYKNCYTIFQAIQKYNLDNFEHLFITHPKHMLNKHMSNNMNAARSLLSDEMSKSIFDAILEFRKTFDYSKINDCYSNDMYLPECILSEVKNRKKINIVDCGACFGDLIDLFKRNNIDINKYYAFEPDDNNLKVLRGKVLDENIESCLLPMGVGDFNGEIGFNSGSGTGSAIDEASENKIMITKIDDVILSNVSFVKMDIEGFENEAIRGMKDIILKHKPILAISIYHKPFDFVNILLSLSQDIKSTTLESIENSDLILSSMPYKNFHIRYHGNYGFEFVLYAY